MLHLIVKQKANLIYIKILKGTRFLFCKAYSRKKKEAEEAEEKEVDKMGMNCWAGESKEKIF